MKTGTTLPFSWRKSRLEEVCDIILGQSPPGDTYNADTLGLPFFQGKTEFGDYYPTPRKWCSAPTKIAEAEDVLISVRAPVGPTNLCPSRACIGRGLAAIRPRDGMLPRYVLYALRASVSALMEKATGTTFEAINGSDLRAHLISVAPLPEQRRIVAEIEKQFSRLEEGVNALKRVQANLKRYRAAVLKAACDGKLVKTEAEICRKLKTKNSKLNFESGEQLLKRILGERRKKWSGRGQYKEPAASDTTNLPQLPEGWTWATAEQVTDFITKGATPSAEQMKNGEGDIQFLKVYNLTFSGTLNSSYKSVFISREIHEKELARSKVQSGDILINIVGPPLGQVSIIPETIPEANINQAIARFRVILPECTKLLAYCLMEEQIIGWAKKRAKTTVGQMNLTLELCRTLPIPLPPLAEQKRIVEEVERRLSVVEELESLVTTNLQRATRLRQSILQKAFEGELA